MDETRVAIMNDEGTCFMMEGSAHNTYCSLAVKTQEEKKALFNHINSPDKKLGDFVNMEINLKNVYAETCTYINKETGEATPGVRMVLIDADNVAYASSSSGIYNALTKIFQLFGLPSSWKTPLKVRVKQISAGDNKRVYTLELV